MAGTTVNVSIRMDAEIKTAINVFVRQAVRRGGIPFRVTLGKDRGRELSAAEAEPPERPQGRQEAGGSLGPQEHSSLEDFFARLDAG